MRRRCRHTWTDIGRKAVLGALEDGRAATFKGGMWSQAADDMFYGYTLIQQRCSQCGVLRTQRLKGAWPESSA